jgi:hypothetical protein
MHTPSQELRPLEELSWTLDSIVNRSRRAQALLTLSFFFQRPPQEGQHRAILLAPEFLFYCDQRDQIQVTAGCKMGSVRPQPPFRLDAKHGVEFVEYD